MDEELFVRVVGSLATVVILLVAVVVGALLGNDPDETFAWALLTVVALSAGAVAAVYRFEDRIFRRVD
ncbi:hypothetical protein [Halorubrum sp. AS12]|uniref:hypothetical protein n=1 Tax=Halorubrum sp. AS12 TaxID=3409687 RepID=UPI003DA75036